MLPHVEVQRVEVVLVNQKGAALFPGKLTPEFNRAFFIATVLILIKVGDFGSKLKLRVNFLVTFLR